MSSHVQRLEWKGEMRTPMLAKCKAEECGFVWPCAYLPMEISKIAPLMISASCPMCGAAKPVLA